jgi:hypothetical protein
MNHNFEKNYKLLTFNIYMDNIDQYKQTLRFLCHYDIKSTMKTDWHQNPSKLDDCVIFEIKLENLTNRQVMKLKNHIVNDDINDITFS